MTAVTIPPMPAAQIDQLAKMSPLARWLAQATWAFQAVTGEPEFTRNDLEAVATLWQYFPDDPTEAGTRVAALTEAERAQLVALLLDDEGDVQP